MPSLDEVAADPRRVAELDADERRRLITQCAAIIAAASAQPLSEPPAIAQPRAADADDELRPLDCEGAARALGKSVDWIKRHARELPFAKRIGRTWRFSPTGVRRYLEGRRS